jgi:hypothetical protein
VTVPEAHPTPLALRLLRLALALGVPLLVLLTGAWYAANSAARVWPMVDAPEPMGPPPALVACEGGDDILEDLLRLAERLEPGALAEANSADGEGDPETSIHQALDRLIACGGLRLTGGRDARRAGLRLQGVVDLRLARAWQRSEAGDLEGGARDLASVLELSAILEHAGGDLALCSLGVTLGLTTVEQIERWLEANPQAPDQALALLAEPLQRQVQLLDGVLQALVWECRVRESELQRLGQIPAPAMLLEPAGVPLWAGWLAGWLPGATVYDAPRTLAMHRHRCGLNLATVADGGLWDQAELGPVLWDREQLSLGRLLDNPLGRATLEGDSLATKANLVVEAERVLRSRRALLATRVAVERGSLAHDGLLPLQLEQLVPEFLPEAPVDPVDGQPINWVRSHGEIFTSREVPTPEGGKVRLMTKVPKR